ncbi:esterase/lipase family protein [Aspergillus neoniger CBS 115656]|uniref:DUF676 domain-containing protein n=1 Tax=Aspergillus neoniger (strain CBS 115656) TaxID=1448310 RepID=A0A318YL03_ASPNB|nr:hypothetical protein BO87DRAFT_387824 [Aspergillus neoniger CBS 115656]PYH33080.1 hypothetical protein BO87DRAFT_387824 [Aspergillus neoniger CBS 115656]
MTTDTNITTAGHLQVLLDPAVTSQDSVDIILVPGIGTIPPKNWPFANTDWLASLPGSGAKANVLSYEYSSPLASRNPSWESILMLGYDLLQNLSDFRSGSDLDSPILLVCHSLGGLIVKQALCVANKQITRYGSIVNAIAGVIFFSTPHRYGDGVTSLMRFRDILEATTGRKMKLSKSSVEQEGAVLLDLADRFEGISFRSPILSIYELRQTKSGSIPLRWKYQQLVEREACLTHAPMETVIGLNINHHEICLFTKSAGNEGIPELEKFVHDTLNDAMLLVAFRLKDPRCNDEQYSTTMSGP